MKRVSRERYDKRDTTTRKQSFYNCRKIIGKELYFACLLQPATYVVSCFKLTNRRLLELPKMPLPLFVCACERLGDRGSRGAFFFTIQVSLATKMGKKKVSLLLLSPFFSGHYLARILGDPGARRKVMNGEKSPWGQCLTRSVPPRLDFSSSPLSAPGSPRMSRS